MADQELKITITLDDQVSAALENIKKNINNFGNGLENVGHSIEGFGRELRTVAREVGNLGSVFAIWGAAGVAPFALALNNSKGSVIAVGEAMNKLGDVVQKFQESIASSVVPIVNNFTRQVNGLLQAWLKLPQAFRDQITQTILVTASLTLLAGVFIKIGSEILKVVADVALLTGKFIQWIGTMIVANPILLAVGAAIAVIIVLMIKFQGVCNTVISTFEFLTRALWTGLLTIQLAFATAVKVIADNILNIVTLLARIPGPSQKAFQSMIADINGVRRTMQDMIHKDITGISTESQKMGAIIKTGTGEWSKAIDGFKGKVEDVFNAFKQGSNTVTLSNKTIKAGIDGTISAMGTLDTALQGAAAQNKDFAVAAQAVSLALAIINTAQGVTKALSDYMWPFNMIVAGIVGAAGAIQIGTIASQKFATGTDSVPSMLSPGEMVVPSSMAQAIRAGRLSLGGPEGGGGMGDVNIYIAGVTLSSNQNIRQFADTLGFEIQRKLRSARSNL